MKKWLALFSLLGMIWWTAPSTYTDGTPILASDKAKITYRIYVDETEFAAVTGGALEWKGTLPQKPGETRQYTATAEYPGQPESKSEFTSPVTFTYYLMLSPPGDIQIHLGN